MALTKRKFPYPWRSMVAIDSDIDASSYTDFVKLHRFLNTDDADIPYYGAGVGLDIGDSFFYKNCTINGIALYDSIAYYLNDNEALAATITAGKPDQPDYRWLDAANARDASGSLKFTMLKEHIRKMIECGWIRTLHSGEGNFDSTILTNGGTSYNYWTNKDGEDLRDWLIAQGKPVKVCTEHSTVRSNFFTGQGADPAQSGYWAPRAREAGIKYLWANDGANNRGTCGTANMLLTQTFGDGSKFWKFWRYWGTGSYSSAINNFTNALNTTNFNNLVNNGYFEVFATHFGYWIDGSGNGYNMWDPEMPTTVMDAFRLLRQYQDDGKILVARTDRLLDYNLAYNNVVWSETPYLDGTDINITSVNDTHLGAFTPNIEDLRGVTFYVPNATKVRLRVNGTVVPEVNVIRAPADHTGQQSIGIRWYDYDRTDYSTYALTDSWSATNTGRIQVDGLSASAGFADTLTLGTPFALNGSTITASAPIGQRTSALCSVTGAAGTIRVLSDRFDVSTDDTPGSQTLAVPEGTTQFYLGVTPQSGDGTLTTRLGVPA